MRANHLNMVYKRGKVQLFGDSIANIPMVFVDENEFIGTKVFAH